MGTNRGELVCLGGWVGWLVGVLWFGWLAGWLVHFYLRISHSIKQGVALLWKPSKFHGSTWNRKVSVWGCLPSALTTLTFASASGSETFLLIE